jgi:hypothetical protein
MILIGLLSVKPCIDSIECKLGDALMRFWLNYFICLIRNCQYLIKEINTCGCDYAFDAEKQGVVQTLHQVFNQTD